MLEITDSKKLVYWQCLGFALFFLFITLSFTFNAKIFSTFALIALLPTLFYPYLCIPVMLISIYLGIFYLPFGIPLSFFIYGLFSLSVGVSWLAHKKVAVNKALIAAGIILFILSNFSTMASVSAERIQILEIATSIAILVIFSLYSVKDTLGLTYLLYFAAALFVIFNFALFLAGMLPSLHHRISILPNINVNSYGVALCQIGIVLACAFTIFQKLAYKIAMALLFLANLYLLFLTGSRTSLLSLLFVTALIILFSRTLKTSTKTLIFLAGLVFASALFFFTDAFTIFLGRTGGFSGRTDIWKATAFHIIPNNFWIGIGFSVQDMGKELSRYGANTSYAHNLVLSALAQGGIFFFITLVIIIIISARAALLAAKVHPYASLPAYLLASLLLIGIAEDIYFSKFFWCIMGWGLMYYNSLTRQGQGGYASQT